MNLSRPKARGARRYLRRVVLIVAAITLCDAVTLAVEFHWNRAAESDWWYDAEYIDGTDPAQYISNWGTIGNPPAFPGVADDVFVEGEPYTTTVGLDGYPSIDTSINNLTVDADCGVLVHVRTLTLNGSALSNEGLVTVRSAGAHAYLVATSDMTFSGSGRMKLDHTSTWGGTAHLMTTPGATITNATDHTIEGEGRIEAALVNRGTIVTDPDTDWNSLYLTGEDKTNEGTIAATDGENLQIIGITLANSGTIVGSGTGAVQIEGITLTQTGSGRLIADGGENIQLAGNVTISGGTLETPNGGSISSGTGAHTITLEDVTNKGTLYLGAGNTTRVTGSGLHNDGKIVVNRHRVLQHSYLTFDNDATLAGSGKVSLNGLSRHFGPFYAYLDVAEGHTLHHAASHSIVGRGHISGGTIDNLGTIEAYNGTLEINSAVTQHVGDTLTGGTWIARQGSSRGGLLDITTGSDITTNQATVILDGSSSRFDKINSLADNQGDFSILGGRDFSTVSDLNNSGTITVGHESTLDVNGRLTMQPGSTYVCQVGSAGMIDVAGELDLSAADDALRFEWPGTDPWSTFGGEYVVAGYGSLAGTFHSVGGGDGTYDIGKTYVANVDYVTNQRVTVSLYALLVGDLDLDGDVDFFDYITTSNNFGETEGMRFQDGDMDGDGDVDFFDYIAVSNHFGDTVPAIAGVAGAAEVPEPSTVALLVCGALGLLAYGWRRRRH